MLEVYITVKGKLDPAWSDWFDGLTVEALPAGDTILRGIVPDQSAVYGILSRLSNLGIPLISCECRERGANDFASAYESRRSGP